MNWQSLRLRLIAGGVVAILLALGLSGAALVLIFERHVTRTLAADLAVILNQVVGGLDVDSEGRLTMANPPSDPRFAEPLSGLYWQVTATRGGTLASRSLWDAALPVPADVPGDIHEHQIAGPGGQRVLAVERVVKMTVAGMQTPVRIVVAADLARIAAAAAAFARDLAAALIIVGLVLAAATAVQVSIGLRPLALLRRGVADIRAGRVRHLPQAVPAEVRPLVAEVNSLLDARENEIERSRRRAADLAHGLKTPLAALSGDARRLRADGQSRIADEIESAADIMSRHVDRELARARIRGGVSASAALAPLVRSLVDTLARTPSGARIKFELEIPAAVSFALDRTDLAEVLGNLLENAARHAASRVRVSAAPDGSMIAVEDDGPGIAAQDRARVMQRGGRLDERPDGAGLGLAIVQDVLDAYGWSLQLGESAALGGLQATIAPAGEAAPHALNRSQPVGV